MGVSGSRHTSVSLPRESYGVLVQLREVTFCRGLFLEGSEVVEPKLVTVEPDTFLSVGTDP